MDSGTARDAGSRFAAVIGASNVDFLLRETYALDTTAGSSRLSIDKAVEARCGAFMSFGTWSTTLR